MTDMEDSTQTQETLTQKPPATWPELARRLMQVLGFTATALLFVAVVSGCIAYRVLPRWVESNTKVQESLTQNLEQQTLNIAAQTENIKAQTNAVKEVQAAVVGIASATEARDRNWQEFSKLVSVEHHAQMESHAKIVSTLETIQDVIVNREVVVVKPE